MGSTHWIYLIIDEREKTLRVCTEGAAMGKAHCRQASRSTGLRAGELRNEKHFGIPRQGVYRYSSVWDFKIEVLS